MRQLFQGILLLLCLSTFGQKDSSAEPYLNKLSEQLSGENALEIVFTYIREDLQSGSEMTGEGSVVMMGEKYKLDLGEAIVYYNGEKQYSLNKEIEEVYVSVPDPENKEFLFSDPLRLLKTYKTEFKYRLMGSVTYEQIQAEEVQLYPEELGGPYALIKLYFSKKNSDLKAIVIRQKDGILYTMQLKTIDEKGDPGSGFFSFNQDDFPNVDVIELLD